MSGVRAIASAALACLMFAACASGSGSPSASYIAQVTASPAAVDPGQPSATGQVPAVLPTASGTRVSPAPAPCAAAKLEVRGGRMGGGTGTAQGDIYFTNVGPTPCSLSGEPKRIELLRADGSDLAITAQGPETTPGPPATLAPGTRDAASLAFNWANWCGKAPGPLRVRITLLTLRAGDSVMGPFDGPPGYAFVPRCDQPSQPSFMILLWSFANPTP